MAIPSSRSLIFEVKSTGSELAFGRLRQASDVFGRLRTSSGIFGNDRVVFKNPSTPRIKISRLYLRKSWQVYILVVQSNLTCKGFEVVGNKNHTIFLGRARDVGKFEKQGNFLLPRIRKECAPDFRCWLTTSSRIKSPVLCDMQGIK